MKTICKATWLACTALTFGLMSCNNNDSEATADNGLPTYMGLNLNFPQPAASRANSGDAYATPEESAVKTVDVFIYTAKGGLQSHEALTINDFESAESDSDSYNYKGKAKIKTTTGLKYIYVGVNLPSQTVQEILGKPMSDLANVEHKLDIKQFTSSTDGFIMFNKAVVSTEFGLDPTAASNNPSITVQRLVAKVTVQKSANLVVDGTPGTIGNVVFAINNNNRKFFLMQGAAPAYKDPNWAGTHVAEDFYQAVPADFMAVNEASVTNVAELNAGYAVENTSEIHATQDITRATIRATFIPKKVLLEAGDSYELGDSPFDVPTTFYRVRLQTPAGGDVYTFNRTLAVKYANDNGISEQTIEEFTDGLCYYDMFLNKNNWDVLRNEYFKCTITRIMAPGRSTPELTDPTNPPSKETQISVDINVLFWNTPVTQSYELEP